MCTVCSEPIQDRFCRALVSRSRFSISFTFATSSAVGPCAFRRSTSSNTAFVQLLDVLRGAAELDDHRAVAGQREARVVADRHAVGAAQLFAQDLAQADARARCRRRAARCISNSSLPASAKNEMHRLARRLLALLHVSLVTTVDGNRTPMSRNAEVFLPVDGRPPTHRSTSGVISSHLERADEEVGEVGGVAEARADRTRRIALELQARRLGRRHRARRCSGSTC